MDEAEGRGLCAVRMMAEDSGPRCVMDDWTAEIDPTVAGMLLMTGEEVQRLMWVGKEEEAAGICETKQTNRSSVRVRMAANIWHVYVRVLALLGTKGDMSVICRYPRSIFEG